MKKWNVSYDLRFAGLMEIEAKDADEAEDKLRNMTFHELWGSVDTGTVEIMDNGLWVDVGEET